MIRKVMQSEYDKLLESLSYVKSFINQTPKVGIVCGSGLGDLVKMLEKPISIPYSSIPHFPKSTVEGHSGELVFGETGQVSMVCMRGRVHLYEGYEVVECIRPIRLMAMLGIEVLCVTNAAGNVNKNFKPGQFMIINDHISFPSMAGENPLRGPHDVRFGARFVTMSNAYDSTLISQLEKVSADIGLKECVKKGVYAMVIGPNYETIAEARALRMLGADAVGMSTVHEIIAAHQMGVKCLAVSLLTNDIVTEYDKSHDLLGHSEVVDMGKNKSQDFIRLIVSFIHSNRKDQPSFESKLQASMTMVLRDLSDMRKPYRDQNDGLEESELATKNPMQLFDNWLQMVKESGTVYEPNAFCISTADKNGQPSSRMVLLKGYGPEGFKFFTHYTSQKGRNIAENPKVSMLFYWDSFNRQVRIEGNAHKLTVEEADDYFKRRPQSSQIGAAISDQKSLIESRQALIKRYDDLKAKLGNEFPFRPATWGGFCVVPERFEFWQGNTNRVHDRIIFRHLRKDEKIDNTLTKEVGDGWFMERMLP